MIRAILIRALAIVSLLPGSALARPPEQTARFISFNSSDSITFERTADGTVRQSGSYTLKNAGDEPAHNVAVELMMAGWRAELPAVVLQPGQQHSWNLAGSFPAALLSCLEPSCEEAGMPESGEFVLHALIRYEDRHGYRFSNAVAKKFIITGGSPGYFPRPDLAGRMQLKPAGQNIFKGTFELVNVSNEALRIKIGLNSPDELAVGELPKEIALPPGGQGSIPVTLASVTALARSSYALNAVAQWQAGGQRRACIVNTTVEVASAAPVAQFSAALALFCSVPALLFFLLLRRRQGHEA